MRPRLAWLALSFVGLTAALTWVWVEWGAAAYERFLLAAAGPLLEALGVTRIIESPARLRFVSYVPFLVLMGITPGLSLRRRLGGTVAGFALIFLAHVALLGVEQWSRSEQRPAERPFTTLLPAVLFADSLPFMLWAVIAQRFVRGLFVRYDAKPAPDADA
jgi:hypothetical protein